YDAFNAPAAREAASATMDALLDTRAVEARLARVLSPALVVWGRNDALAPAAIGRKLARALPDARLELFDCGHSPAEEMPDRFAERVLEFLEPRRRERL
ncbi:MAG TPA: alpha/beta hydrolase, partial [Polyangiaceae bacterium]